jgi:hypothetical protein
VQEGYALEHEYVMDICQRCGYENTRKIHLISGRWAHYELTPEGTLLVERYNFWNSGISVGYFCDYADPITAYPEEIQKMILEDEPGRIVEFEGHIYVLPRATTCIDASYVEEEDSVKVWTNVDGIEMHLVFERQNRRSIVQESQGFSKVSTQFFNESDEHAHIFMEQPTCTSGKRCPGCGATINGTIYRDSSALGNYTNYSVHNNAGAAGKATTGQTDSATGYTYSRMQANPESGSATIQGRNFLGGSAASGINFLIFRYRVGENGLGQENITLYFNAQSETNSLRINVEEDNTWHTVVVDLKACVGDGTVYDGSYTNAYFRPFGDLTGDTVRSNADAYVDFAYTIGCGSLEDAMKILGTDTYEWLNGSTVEVRDSATHQVVTAE